MSYPLQGGGSGGSGAFVISHYFTDTTARDTYFASHSSELITGVVIAIGTTSYIYQQYNSGWIDVTAIVQGPAGSFPTINSLTEKLALDYEDLFIVEDSDTSTNKKAKFSTLLKIPQIGTATVDNLIEYINAVGFTGRISGGIITDAGSGSASVSSGTGLIRSSDSEIKSFDWATASVTLTDNSINYVVVSYNSGTPLIYSTVTRSDITWTDIFPLGRVYRSGTSLSIINSGVDVDNFAGRVHDRDLQVDGFAHVSGSLISNPSGLYIATSFGTYYLGVNKVTTAAKNTYTGDTFTYWYRNGTGWTTTTGNTTIDETHYDDGSGTLATVSNAKHSVHWVYVAYNGDIHIQYGQLGTYSLATASEATPPSPPSILEGFAILVGKVITLKTGTTFAKIQSAFDKVFSATSAGDHAALSNLDYANSGHTGFQAQDATLTALAELTTAADKLPYFTGVDTVSTATFTSMARSLLDDATAADMRTTLGAQTLDADLTAIAALSGTSGYLKKTAADTWALDTSTFATVGHIHSKSDVTGLVSDLANKATNVWIDITGTTQTLVVNSNYIADNTAQVVFTLPSSSSVGNMIRIAGAGTGGWKVAQNASQQIVYGSVTTTAGTGGYVYSNYYLEDLWLLCIAENTKWKVVLSTGNPEFV